jgi:hypothetical protein
VNFHLAALNPTLSGKTKPAPAVPNVQPLCSVHHRISPFQLFQPFNRCAPFKTFQVNAGSSGPKFQLFQTFNGFAQFNPLNM